VALSVNTVVVGELWIAYGTRMLQQKPPCACHYGVVRWRYIRSIAYVYAIRGCDIVSFFGGRRKATE